MFGHHHDQPQPVNVGGSLHGIASAIDANPLASRLLAYSIGNTLTDTEATAICALIDDAERFRALQAQQATPPMPPIPDGDHPAQQPA